MGSLELFTLTVKTLFFLSVNCDQSYQLFSGDNHKALKCLRVNDASLEISNNNTSQAKYCKHNYCKHKYCKWTTKSMASKMNYEEFFRKNTILWPCVWIKFLHELSLDFSVKVNLLYLLVDDHSNSTLCDIENTPCFSMVDLVWHAFMNSTINLEYKWKKKKKKRLFILYT